MSKRNDLDNIKPIDLPAEEKERRRRKIEIIIGIILLILILAGGGILNWRSGKWRPMVLGASTDGEAALKSEIANLNQKIDDLNKKIDELSQSAPGETVSTDTQTVSVKRTASGNSSSQPVGKVNINTATATQLDSLPGIGPTYAARIIEYRNTHGLFKSTEELKNVKGIGDKTFQKLQNSITL